MGDNDITLLDMKIRDVDNLSHILKKRSKRYYFKNLKACEGFINKALYGTLGHLGLDIVELEMNEHKIDAELQRLEIVVENRPYEGEDRWRAGLYIYYKGEIVQFIGHPEAAVIVGPNGEPHTLISTFGHSIEAI